MEWDYGNKKGTGVGIGNTYPLAILTSPSAEEGRFFEGFLVERILSQVLANAATCSVLVSGGGRGRGACDKVQAYESVVSTQFGNEH